MYFIDSNGNKFICDFNFSKCESLVISGGAFKCIYALGALSKIFEKFNLNLKNYIGTSSGSVICTLLSIGYTPIEIIQYLFKLNKSERPSIRSLRDFAISKVEDMIKEKGINNKITFYEHYKMTGKNLLVVTTNVTSGYEEIFSWNNSPKVEITTALKLSCSLPFIFPFAHFNHSMYIDGIFSDNFPLKIASNFVKTKTFKTDKGIDKEGHVLGISTKSSYVPKTLKKFYCNPDIYKILFIPDKVKKHFTTSKDDIFCMYMIGYNFVDSNLRKNNNNIKRTKSLVNI
jgi:hypothetical protein